MSDVGKNPWKLAIQQVGVTRIATLLEEEESTILRKSDLFGRCMDAIKEEGLSDCIRALQ